MQDPRSLLSDMIDAYRAAGRSLAHLGADIAADSDPPRAKAPHPPTHQRDADRQSTHQ